MRRNATAALRTLHGLDAEDVAAIVRRQQGT
jgi:hypothetical protein